MPLQNSVNKYPLTKPLIYGSATITADNDYINEGQSVTYYISTTGIPNNAVLYWINIGTTTGSDFSDGLNSGTVTILNGAANFTRTLINDVTTEGLQTISIRLHLYSPNGKIVGQTAVSTTVNDTSTGASPSATYSLTPAASNVNEGNSLTFFVGGSNIVNGTYYWTVTNSGDFGTSSGSFTITSNSGSFSVVPTADSNTEGSETFTASIRAGSTSGTILATSSSVTINDTSTTPPPPTPTLTVEYYLLAGGGGGGRAKQSATVSPNSDWIQWEYHKAGGGGGAGGYARHTASIPVNGSHTITVGAGGVGGTVNNRQGINGSNSSISGSTINLTVYGGGGGGGNAGVSPNGGDAGFNGNFSGGANGNAGGCSGGGQGGITPAVQDYGEAGVTSWYGSRLLPTGSYTEFKGNVGGRGIWTKYTQYRDDNSPAAGGGGGGLGGAGGDPTVTMYNSYVGLNGSGGNGGAAIQVWLNRVIGGGGGGAANYVGRGNISITNINPAGPINGYGAGGSYAGTTVGGKSYFYYDGTTLRGSPSSTGANANAVANTGSGGGASGATYHGRYDGTMNAYSREVNGGSGSAGTVVIRYASASIKATGGTISQPGDGYVYHTFDSSGTFTVTSS